MNDEPIYISKQQLPDAQIGAIVPGAAQSVVGEAVSQAADAATNFADRLQHAQVQTRYFDAAADYTNKLDALKTQYQQDPDFQTAPKRFSQDVKQLQTDTIADAGFMDPVTRARLNDHMTVHAVSALTDIRQRALGQERDTNVANLDTQEQQNLTAAATGSPVERQAAVQANQQNTQTAADAGWISRVDQVTRNQRFDMGLQHADVMRSIALNPTQAIADLNDPTKYLALSAPQREAYIETARGQVDKRGTEAAIATSANFPAAASMIAGQIVHPQHADDIYNRVILPMESSGGKNLPPNEAGAFGPAQLLPGTARDLLKSAGRNDLASLNDADLTAALMKQPDLNKQLGLNYWHQLQQRYAGNVPAMMAAYQSGPQNADQWKAAAEAKFGQSFTPEQFLSVIPDSHPAARDYITKGYTIAGARLDAFGVSPAGRFQLGTSLGAQLSAQETSQNSITNKLATIEAHTDPIVDMINQGLDVAPDRIATYRSTQLAAAQNGDVTAMDNLRKLDFAIAQKPHVDRAYSMDFAHLDNLVNTAGEAMKEPGANVTPAQQNTYQAYKTVRDTILQKRKDDPTGLLVKSGNANFVPLDPGADTNDPNLRAALQQRGVQAQMAAQLYGGSQIALTPPEVTAMAQRYQDAQPNAQFALLKTLADTLLPISERSYLDTVKKVVGNDQMGTLIGNTLAMRPDLAREMLQGAALMKQKEVQEKASVIRPALSSILGGAMFSAPDQAQVVNTALQIDAARRAANGQLYEAGDSSGVEKALTDIIGPVVKINGMKTPIAPGVSPYHFLGALDHLNEADLATQGGAMDVNGYPVAAATLKSIGVLKPLVPGSTLYAVGARDPRSRDGFRPYFTQGTDTIPPQPLVFDMAVLASRHPEGSGSVTAIGGPRAGMAIYRGRLAAELQQTRRDEGNPP